MYQNLCPNCLRPHKGAVLCPYCGYDVTTPNSPHQLPTGTVLRGRYVLGRVLGQGGFGITYLGWDQIQCIPVAVKEFFPTGVVMRSSAVSLSISCIEQQGTDIYQRNRQRFLNEAKLLARFSHLPQIVHIRDSFLENETAYIVMEYIHGITLRDYVRCQNSPLNAEMTLHLLEPILQGLQQVHGSGLIHRDISPDNIMLLADGTVKLLDFGASRDMVNRDKNHPLSKSTQSIVKPGYTPIEQYQSRGILGPWTDVYALSAVFYYCLTGEHPLEAPELLMEDQQLDWSAVPGLSPQQRKALQRGSALMVDNRTGSMEELYQELYCPYQPQPVIPVEAAQPLPTPQPQTIPAAPPVPAPEPPQPEPPKTQKKKRSRLPLILAVIVVVAAALALLLLRKPTPVDVETEPTAVSTATEVTTVPTTEATEPFDDSLWRSNVLMADPWDAEKEVNTVLGSQILREQVVSFTFLETLEAAPEDSWDVSQAQDGSVMAWAEAEEDRYHITVAAEGGINAANCASLFRGYSVLEEIQFNDCFHTTYATDMTSMFHGCALLEQLDLSGFDTANVESMSSLFDSCKALYVLDISSFDTSRVIDMTSMFINCYCLLELDLSHFDTSQVQYMNSMFCGCVDLFDLNISSFDTSQVLGMNSMFSGCLSLSELDVSHFHTENVTDMSAMFSYCASVRTLDVRNFQTGNVANMYAMFQCCTSLQELDVRSFQTGNVVYMGSMFALCSELRELDVSGFDLSGNPDTALMFLDCPAGENADPERFPPADEATAEIMRQVYQAMLERDYWTNTLDSLMAALGLIF